MVLKEENYSEQRNLPYSACASGKLDYFDQVQVDYHLKVSLVSWGILGHSGPSHEQIFSLAEMFIE